MRLENKIAIITGAASGFGEGMARRFAAEGAKVVVADLNEASGNTIAEEIGGIFVKTDVSRDSEMANLVQTTVQTFGAVDIFVNNAGYTSRNSPMLDVDEETFDRIYAVNVKAVYLSARHVIPEFRKKGRGMILNIASTGGVRPRPGLVWYNSSKGAVISLTRSMAIELAPEKIRVCAINPVAGKTGMLPLFMGEETEEKYELFRSSIPLGRLSTPKDIANTALFLCSDEADFITGVCMEVDGGRCI
ncbi:MAG: SDR family oxidoreductase [Deltaproteobacteria bacterium]|jgi:3-oxoacyl-[acyl-carrier protein] reductase|nr:SDR family oxidoreductase [Deltaproteobacteria bacterium]MBT4638972.1 SDR family oxidoreductase [Deltaproteobacteria bacterium]MBT6504457.1 SDR family oxidoreductase [Deltaproteobacteria bacterium]MBT6615600.1 SDR family oxidoreductase [Deltaproteobacteria bacterium]MBT7151740.1 SDR family oxidoreductase [Deltaproteobacteria bacterium]